MPNSSNVCHSTQTPGVPPRGVAQAPDFTGNSRVSQAALRAALQILANLPAEERAVLMRTLEAKVVQ